MSVFTVINNGTKMHRNFPYAELISTFGRMMYWETTNADGGGAIRGGKEYETYLITDGPGSAPNDIYNPTPGKYRTEYNHEMMLSEKSHDFDPKGKYPEPMKRAKGKLKYAMGQSTTVGTGQLTGKGWEKNVKHFMSFMEWRKKSKAGLPTSINMLGWSRGSITCIRMAYMLYKASQEDIKYDTFVVKRDPAYGLIDVNMFLIDPVAGIGNRATPSNCMINSNVKNLVATYALHDIRGGFAPQDLTVPTKEDAKNNTILDAIPDTRLHIVSSATKYLLLPLPGKHESHVKMNLFKAGIPEEENLIKEYFKGNYKLANQEMSDPGQVAFALAYAFMRHHGTEFEDTKAITVNVNGSDKIPIKYGQVLRSYLDQSPDVVFQDLLDRYTRMRIYMPVYQKYLSNSRKGAGGMFTKIQGGQRWRNQLGEIHKYVKYPGFFVNEQHRWLLMKLYPRLYKEVSQLAENEILEPTLSPAEEPGNKVFCGLYKRFVIAGIKDSAIQLKGKSYHGEPSEDPTNPRRSLTKNMNGAAYDCEPPHSDSYLDEVLPELFGSWHESPEDGGLEDELAMASILGEEEEEDLGVDNPFLVPYEDTGPSDGSNPFEQMDAKDDTEIIYKDDSNPFF